MIGEVTGIALDRDGAGVHGVEVDGRLREPDAVVIPRPDGTVYLCSLSGQKPLPTDPSVVDTDLATTARLKAMAAALSPDLADAAILAAQACYHPVIRDGLPLMGAVPGIKGAYVATGHSVWRMLNAPASGEAIAGLILAGRSETVDLSAFDPGRFSGPRSWQLESI